jgi:hypothetical protein
MGTPASLTTKTGRLDIAEILLKVALNKNQINDAYCVFITVTQTNVIDWCNVVVIRLNHSKHMNASRFFL